jgi:hypothetical protein
MSIHVLSAAIVRCEPALSESELTTDATALDSSRRSVFSTMPFGLARLR